MRLLKVFNRKREIFGFKVDSHSFQNSSEIHSNQFVVFVDRKKIVSSMKTEWFRPVCLGIDVEKCSGRHWFSPARVSLYVYNMYMAVCISGWSSSGGSAGEWRVRWRPRCFYRVMKRSAPTAGENQAPMATHTGPYKSMNTDQERQEGPIAKRNVTNAAKADSSVHWR